MFFFFPPFRLHGRHDSTFSETLEGMDDLAFFQQLRLSKAAFDHLHSLLRQQEQEDVTVYKREKKKITLTVFVHYPLVFGQ